MPDNEPAAEDILADPRYTACVCTEDCQYHGKCAQCVALHRYYKHVPTCLTAVNCPEGDVS